ncbi:type I pantothenate kinase [Pontibacillus sp. HMF3514]|uniref:type I pantothenate kinase n=1 Tax=Pontibacillus sp. HMF3514 TaxID=2692425 RepID=UPI00132009D2|nr:type I pantothenate kinase [Pontibacillus sp. HMF3514]QHE53504.1 type I pantothenate kinase [Pontibacillus sp. HMF3514]
MSSPYISFDKEEWSKLKANVPMTISAEQLENLKGINEALTMEEVSNVYLPLSRLLNLYTRASQQLHTVTDTFLGKQTKKVPFIIGIAGSVAVGKSTSSRIIQALLKEWHHHPNVDILTTDGFLYPNKVLEERGIMNRKGFPESYNTKKLLNVLGELKSGNRHVTAPVYSHLTYDILEDEVQVLDQPDIVIVEGINVLQTPKPKKAEPETYVSDFFDFSIYVDAHEDYLKKWYINRFMKLRDTAFQDEKSYFHKYADLTDEEAIEIAEDIWNRINLKNLRENIRTTRKRADLILQKDSDHFVDHILLRKM